MLWLLEKIMYLALGIMGIAWVFAILNDAWMRIGNIGMAIAFSAALIGGCTKLVFRRESRRSSGR